MLAGAGLMLNPIGSFGYPKTSTHFGVNPFILQNPDAVFIMTTGVDVKTNGPAIKAAGLDFGRSVFGFTNNTVDGIPLTHKVVIKPNLTCRQRGQGLYTIENSMGIVTDAHFVEGIIESLKELGISAGQFFIREVNCPDDLADGGYLDMASRTGIDLKAIDTPASALKPEQVVWVDVPNGVWFKKIPYLWPVHAPDTWLLNISKFKAHSMGLTLCAKNIQGTIAMNYQAHCTAYGVPMEGVDPAHIHPDADAVIKTNYDRHRADGIPRWDKPGTSGGLSMETWATRCLDNNSVNFAGLHIIEGIYGRDGNFLEGPSAQNLATDFMTNYIIFGRNQFYVDIIGHYLGGHEPGNFGLFHLAKERGMTSTINPAAIPLYHWDPVSGAALAGLSSFKRYPLQTIYLQRNYNGQTEPRWHLVNEPYDYGTNAVDEVTTGSDEFYIQPVFPNPVQDASTIRFYIPRNGRVSVEILDAGGRFLEVLVDRQLYQGNHSVTWNSSHYTSGLYTTRMRFEGVAKIQRMMISR